MLERALHEIATSFKKSEERSTSFRDLEDRLLDQSDDAAVDDLLRIAHERQVEPAIHLLRDLRSRRLYHSVYTRFWEQMAPDISARLFDLFTYTEDAPQRRNQAVAHIEADLGLRPGSLVMYCPHHAMNAKIAEVKIYIHGTVTQLDQWEADNSNALTGGHLDAQLNRFKRLDREEYKRLAEDRRYLLREAIKKLVLKVPTDTPIDEEARAFAAVAARVPGVPFYGKEPDATLVATRDAGSATLNYPNGAPTLRSFFA
jgi:hypothetical protein